jgi:transcriptional regulator of arginine metabolism
MAQAKRLRQGRILRLVSQETIFSQEDLRRKLAGMKMAVTQATLSRDLRELKLVKTERGYKPLASAREEPGSLAPLTRALREFLLDIRAAHNLLVLRTPPGGAQPLAAALDAERLEAVTGTIAGDDTVLVITPSASARLALERRIGGMLA